MLSERAQVMARHMVLDGMSQTDAYRASGYKGKDPAVRAGGISSKQEFKDYCAELRNKETDARIASKVFTYDQILEKIQELINDDDLSNRDKISALKLLGSAKTIAAWKEVSEVKLNAHESFILGNHAD